MSARLPLVIEEVLVAGEQVVVEVLVAQVLDPEVGHRLEANLREDGSFSLE